MVLKNNGDVWITGYNLWGQLGNGKSDSETQKGEFAFVIGTWGMALGNTVLCVRFRYGVRARVRAKAVGSGQKHLGQG